VFRFVFVCSVFWVEFQQRWWLLLLLGEREEIGGIVTGSRN
jgi:hypothetical protein